jgi:DNA-directed RNA polymerase sigma subunit (sigma70/sigma32)
MRECCKKCLDCDVSCPIENSDCRHWIDYENDSNCTLIAVENNDSSKMTLREVSIRLGVSFVRVKQIEDSAIKKLSMYNKKNKIIQ